MRSFGLVCLMGVLMTACSGRVAERLSPAATPAAASNTGAPSAGLTAEQVRNMKIRLVANNAHQTVQLVDGGYKNRSDPTSSDYMDISLLVQPMAFGDLNGDGQADAAALLAENYGGTGVFVSVVAVLNAGGQPAQAGAVPIDDRPNIHLLAIQERQILLAGNVHGPDDPGCCPALPVSQAYALTKSGLVLRRQASTTPDGKQRLITIQSPTQGSAIPAGPLQVKGTYTVPPFENTLTYRVFNAMQDTLAAGTLLADNGVFEASIDLTGLPAGVLVRLEIEDLSAANGATLAMDSVELMIK